MGALLDRDHINDSMDQVTTQANASTFDTAAKIAGVVKEALYISDDAYNSDPLGLIGRVYYQLEDGELEGFVNNLRLTVDPSSKASKPVIRDEIILNHESSVAFKALSFVDASVGEKEVSELRVIDNMTAFADVASDEWDGQLSKWRAKKDSKSLLAHPQLRRVVVVTGIVQKIVTTKKYQEFEGDAKGGAYGVNVEGRLYTSSESFHLDIVYGLSLQSLVVPNAIRKPKMEFEMKPIDYQAVMEIRKAVGRPDLILESRSIPN